MSHVTGDSPSHSGAQHAVHDETEAECRQRGAHEIELHAAFGRRVDDAARQEEDHDDDQHLAREHPAP
jgi:hypothetical protein